MPRHYSMETRGKQTTATRTELLKAAVEVLAEVGVDALTMQVVAERADMALRTVYNHFPSKEALVVEAYDGLAGYVKEAISALPTGGSPRERLGQFVDAMYDVYEHESPGAAAIMSITGISEYDAHLTAVRSWRRSELSALLRPAARDHLLPMAMKEAVGLAFLWTAYATWHSLVNESGLSPAVAKHLARKSLDVTLFHAPPAD